MNNVVIKNGAVLVCHMTNLYRFDYGERITIISTDVDKQLAVITPGNDMYTYCYLEEFFANVENFEKNMYDKLFELLE